MSNLFIIGITYIVNANGYRFVMSRGSDNVMNWRNRCKKKLIELHGGKCGKCGYDNIDCLRAFDFHHRNPEEKEFIISGYSGSFDKLVK